MTSKEEILAEIKQLNIDIAFAKRNGNKNDRDCLILKKAKLLKKLVIYDYKVYGGEKENDKQRMVSDIK